MRRHGVPDDADLECLFGPETFVVATPESRLGKARTFSSRQRSPSILDCAQATTAAPGFFKAVHIDGERFIDGAVGNNNPASLALDIAFGSNTSYPEMDVACLLSIGTGSSTIKLQSTKGVRRMAEMLRKVAEVTTDVSKVDDQMRRQFGGEVYFRAEPPQEFASVGLGDWREMDRLREMATAYVRTPDVRDQILRCARRLA